MNYQEILEKLKVVFSGGLPKNFKIYLNMSAYANHIGEKSVEENLKSFIIRKVYFTH